ncbi:hypothetical protein MSAN_01572800 [Mycena sanguinolenta]|uniref:BTB domain-containing protein n=1 Tax=Mycena sanguinolenta TaxID=230812 RepID=A0A8H6Y3V5_9AGAR|nr:hypothetical protein MSAN_01572800 [Mycena sanguinolenta]
MFPVLPLTGQRLEPVLVNDAAPTRSEIWMPYGDVILQVESTQFRINKDILARHSSIFRTLFSVPQPLNEPKLEGCPVVQLYGDDAKDWALMLEVLYNPFRHQQAQPTFNVLAAMLRLGRKYDITQAYEDALSRIHHEFPSDFMAFQDLNIDLTRIQHHHGICFDLLNLLFECEIYTSIPLLAFCCIRDNGMEAIVRTGVQRNDGSYAMLSADIKLRMALAFGRIASFQLRSLLWLRDESVIPHRSCQSPTHCAQQRNRMMGIVDQDHEGRFDLSYTIDEWDGRWTRMLCAVCEKAARKTYDQKRAEGWKLLPTFFDLPDWKDLKDL